MTAAHDWWPSAAARASGIALLAFAGILAHVVLRWGFDASPAATALPLYVVLAAGGVPLVLSLAIKLVRREFGSPSTRDNPSGRVLLVWERTPLDASAPGRRDRPATEPCDRTVP